MFLDMAKIVKGSVIFATESIEQDYKPWYGSPWLIQQGSTYVKLHELCHPEKMKSER